MMPGGQRNALPICFTKHVIVVESTIQDIKKAELARFARRAQKLAGVPGEIAVLIADNRRIQELNRRFRKKNEPTDVLSFPRARGGDIAISAEIALDNAGLYGHAPLDEFKILVLHGLLHLAGHDHENDQGEMAAQESLLRKKLKLPDSLIDRAHSQRRPNRRNHQPARKKR
jgi:probable rRNA maturation factor